MIGRTISHYKILEKVGQGGMGVVYKAEDTELKRTVALKFLPARPGEDAEKRERFIHEARSAAAIDHPNICTVHEIGKAEGRTFIAMAYVEGRSLKDVVGAGPMKLSEAMGIALQIAEGLQAAHERGVVHRDIKPANVMITAKGRAKIMDFGLAKSALGVVVTRESTTLGTIAYMSPEQAGGGQVDGRTDIWSLGAVLYEMVTGLRPFRGDYEQAVIYAILNEAPEPVTGLRAGVPLELERVISRCLEKSPDDRYQTAADLVSDLRRAGRALRESAAGEKVAAGFAAGRPGAPDSAGASRAGGDSDVGTQAGEGEPGAITGSGTGAALGPGRRAPRAGPRRTRNWALATATVVLAAIAVIVLRPYFAPPAKVRTEGAGAEESAAVRPGSATHGPELVEQGGGGVTARGGGEAKPQGPGGTIPLTRSASGGQQARKMLVVLPFENLGPPENAYFAAGMTEEITSRLASVRALGVISRTSAVQYDRTGKTVRQIGEDLGVGYVLEGTVRWDGSVAGGSRVRVTPQLIRVSDDTHIWADSYDRELKDIFVVQSDIAGQVVDKLGITLLQPERGAIELRPTENLGAYRAYLRGMEYMSKVDWFEEDMKTQQRMFERAVALDPEFALAYAMLSWVHSGFCISGYDVSDERLSAAKAAAERALELAPDLPEAHIAMGYYYYWGRKEYEPALREFAIAEKALPNDHRILEAEGYIMRRQGKFDEAADRLERALKVNPRNARLLVETGITFNTMREYAQAEDYYNRCISVAPDQLLSYGFMAENILSWKGDLAEARKFLERMGRGDAIYNAWFWLPQERLERNYEAALKTIASLDLDEAQAVWNYISKPLMTAEIYDLMGETSTAHAYYDSARVFLEGLLESNPESHEIHIMLGAAYAGLGRKKDAIRHGRRALELQPLSADHFDGPYLLWEMARIYVVVGELDLAIDEIEHMLSIPCTVSPARLRLDPVWDPLRNRPRFKKLLEGSEKVHK